MNVILSCPKYTAFFTHCTKQVTYKKAVQVTDSFGMLLGSFILLSLSPTLSFLACSVFPSLSHFFFLPLLHTVQSNTLFEWKQKEKCVQEICMT